MDAQLRALVLDADVAGPAGEWLLVTLTIGGRSTAAMAMLVDEGARRLAQFEAHDWDRIQTFALRSQSPPSSRAPRSDDTDGNRTRDVHMPSAFPSTREGLGAPYLQVLYYCPGQASATEEDSLGATLSSHGMVVESVRTLDRCEERLRTSHFHILILTTTRGTPELALLQKLEAERPLVVCLAISAESIDLVRAFEAGADECLTSETSATELAARLLALVLRRRAQNPGAA